MSERIGEKRLRKIINSNDYNENGKQAASNILKKRKWIDM